MLLDKVKQTIIKYNLIKSGDKIVLGVSGGPDSVCMLDILNKLSNEFNFSIVVAHINHGLRENAKIDEKYVKEFCEKLHIKCFVLHADIMKEAKEQKRGIEEMGRIIRYNFFEKIL